MQAEGVDGERVGDVESLLLVTHVGAADGCLPQIEAGVLHRKITFKEERQHIVCLLLSALSGACDYTRILVTRARDDSDAQIMQAEFLCVL